MPHHAVGTQHAVSARRMSARELREEIEIARSEIRSGYLDRAGREGRRYLFADLDSELKEYLEKVRLGKV